MRLLVAVAVTAWVMPSPINIPKEASYWQRLNDNCEAAACNVLSDKRNYSPNETKFCLRELQTIYNTEHGN